MGGGALQVSPPFIMTPDQVAEMGELFRSGLESL
jgi:adenosylmethionine-8-amino-7-oxononanoate aminotransferase